MTAEIRSAAPAGFEFDGGPPRTQSPGLEAGRSGPAVVAAVLVVTRVEVLVLQGASPASVALTVELLQTANLLQRCAGEDATFAISASGAGADLARPFLDPAPTDGAQADVVVLPPLQLRPEGSALSRFAEADANDAGRRLRAARAAGAQLAASCTGVYLLASAGLLDGLRATTSAWLAPILRRQFPAVRLEPDVGVVTDGEILTAGPPLAQLDLMLALVARTTSAELAWRCARHLLPGDHPSSSRYMAASFLTLADERVASAERWALGRLEQSIAVEDLAQAAGMTSRTFARRLHRATGLSPVRFLQGMRVRRAVDLLRTTRLPFDEIARRVGYAEPSTLRRLLRREGAAGARETRNGAVSHRLAG